MRPCLNLMWTAQLTDTCINHCHTHIHICSSNDNVNNSHTKGVASGFILVSVFWPNNTLISGVGNNFFFKKQQ